MTNANSLFFLSKRFAGINSNLFWWIDFIKKCQMYNKILERKFITEILPVLYNSSNVWTIYIISLLTCLQQKKHICTLWSTILNTTNTKREKYNL